MKCIRGAEAPWRRQMASKGKFNLKVNERLQTTAPNVWAVGDCAGSPHFTHISFDDFRIVRDNLTGGDRVTTGPTGAFLHVH
jgi:pyruvate/2-oxoglutarate dehydrogenase complex dihydrolipoamide dehydrogenase (E3) component